MEEGGSSHREGGGDEGGAGSKRKLVTSGELYEKFDKKKEWGVPSSQLKRSKADSWAKKTGDSVKGGTQATLSFSQPKKPELQATFLPRTQPKIASVDVVRCKPPSSPHSSPCSPHWPLTIDAFARRRSLMSTTPSPLLSWTSLLLEMTPLTLLRLHRRTSTWGTNPLLCIILVLHSRTRRHLVSSLLLPAPD
jgi:hypothetical protein